MNIPKPFTKKRSQTIIRGMSGAGGSRGSQKNCFNLDDLMQFEAARQRAVGQLPPETRAKPFSEFVATRIFINHIDTFSGAHLVKYFTDIKREAEGLGETSEVDMNTDDTNMEGETDMQPEDKEPLQNLSRDSLSGDFSRRDSNLFEVIGTLNFYNNPTYKRPYGIQEILDNEKKQDFLEKVLSCGVIIYNVANDLSCHPKQIEEAKWVAENIYKRLEAMEKAQPRVFAKYKDCRYFILISTLMTWTRTKPIDPDDPTLPFTEKDFRKRKPHPNYKIHCQLEKRIIELGKKYPYHLKTIVIGSGVPYGHEEDVLHVYFKMAWQVAPHLPVFKPGKNLVPLIHIDSLSAIIHHVVANFPEKFVYLIATDPHQVTLKEIVKLLAKNLGSGKIQMVTKEEAFVYPDIQQRTYDMLTANINIIPGYIMDKSIVWGTDRPFKENIEKMIIEFKMARGFLPIKIFVHGPPASGKTFLSKRLATYYDIPHLHAKGVIDEAIQILKDKIQTIKDKQAQQEEKERQNAEKAGMEGADEQVNDDEEDEEDEEEEEDDDEDEDLETLTDQLKEIEANMDNEKQRLDEEYVIRFFKEKMLSNACQNKGFVIDGYPKTIEDTKTLYEPQESEVEPDESDIQGSVTHLTNMLIMPAFVESLDASDEFLINRVIKMPEDCVQNTHYEEPEMCRRLSQFRALNTEDNTPLIYYDELDIHPMIYNVELDEDPLMEPTFQAIITRIGPPRNYGLEGAEFEALLKRTKVASQERQADELKAQRDEFKKKAQERRENIEQWMLLKNQELEMEEKALLVMGMPLRHYLMKYIFPTLTRGLVEVARVRPDDPVDFLSEFLFRENPEGKMFQPNYEEREENLRKAIEEMEKALSATREPSSRVTSSRTYSTERSVRSGAVSKVSSYKCSLVSSSSQKRSGSRKSVSIRGTPRVSVAGVCTCKSTPSLSTCSSDATSVTPSSCTCGNNEESDTSGCDDDSCQCVC